MGKLLDGLIKKCLVGVGAAVLLSASMVANAGISGSKHDLTSTGTGTNRLSVAGEGEICVFCHTPHGSSNSAPLWNKNLALLGGTYQQYSSSTMDASATTGGVSLACLSCHDGTQAMDSMINGPGSGNYNASYTTGTARAYSANTWTNGNTDGKMEAGGVFNLGTDLRNDHPIMIPYCGGGVGTPTTGGLTASGATISIAGCADADFNTPVGNASGDQKVWFNTGSGGAGKDKGDIQLYNRSGGATFFVECGSCHDPHNAGGSAPATFLRISNAGSAVCLTCHNK